MISTCSWGFGGQDHRPLIQGRICFSGLAFRAAFVCGPRSSPPARPEEPGAFLGVRHFRGQAHRTSPSPPSGVPPRPRPGGCPQGSPLLRPARCPQEGSPSRVGSWAPPRSPLFTRGCVGSRSWKNQSGVQRFLETFPKVPEGSRKLPERFRKLPERFRKLPESLLTER